jgi:hypothetical protein
MSVLFLSGIDLWFIRDPTYFKCSSINSGEVHVQEYFCMGVGDARMHDGTTGPMCGDTIRKLYVHIDSLHFFLGEGDIVVPSSDIGSSTDARVMTTEVGAHIGLSWWW